MIPLPRLLGFSLVLLLTLLAAAVAAQGWLTRQEARLEKAAIARAEVQLESLIDLTGGTEAAWTEARAERLGAALGGRLEMTESPLQGTDADNALANGHLQFEWPWNDTAWLRVALPAPPVDRILLLFQRVLMALGVFAVLLLLALVAVSVWSRGSQEPDGNRTPMPIDLRSLTQLATRHVAQEEKLEIERDERLRAEAAASLRMNLLNRALEGKINLGRDLHDGIIQSLYATGLTVETARDALAHDPARAAEPLDRAMTMINQAIADTRNYIKGLAPARVRRDSLATALRDMLDELCAGREVAVSVEVPESIPAALSNVRLSDLFQIVREGASNALRHGAASRLELTLSATPAGEVEVVLIDNGQGFDATTPRATAGLGLANLNARAHATGGRLTVTSQVGQGARLHLTWPPASSHV